jgi:phage protein D
MGLLYDTDDDPSYDRVEQTEQSDLAFLLGLCEDAGLSLKITGQQIVIFDDRKYELLPPLIQIVKGKSSVISYSITSSTREVYSAARVEYKGASQKDSIVYTFTPPNKPNTGKTLIINERVTSIAEAERLAKKKLRQQNKEEVKFSLTIMGSVILVAGITVVLQGWGAFDGKYFVEEATHDGGSGYTVKLELRRVLEGY